MEKKGSPDSEMIKLDHQNLTDKKKQMGDDMDHGNKKNHRHALNVLEISIFCHQMALILKSGISPAEGLPLIANEAINPVLKGALSAASLDVEKGKSLYVALENTQVFPRYFMTMINLGELSGMLETVMENLSEYYEKEDRLRKKLRNALTYPALLLILMSGVIVLLVVEVLPMFAKILESLGGDLPVATQVLLGTSAFVGRFGLFAFGVIVIFFIVFYARLQTEKGRIHWDAIKLRLPIIGRVLIKVSASRFSNGLALVLLSGMELVNGLPVVRDLMDNKKVKAMMEVLIKDLAQGTDLGTALENIALFPPLFTHMIRIGQKTGELDTMMKKISGIYDNEVENSLQNMTNAIEPILVIILSAIVGLILLAVMLPLIRIMGTIG